MAKDRWNDLCKLVEKDDGLPTRPVGPWTEQKLFFWNRYLDITTRSMVGHPKWKAGLAYVDLFAGPGVCIIERNGKRIPGSVLLAAHAAKPFTIILASELDAQLADTLRQRLKETPAAATSEVFTGDCNDVVSKIAKKIPERALTLAFIDPEALHVRFETIEVLASRGRVDLLILFADRMDIVRNVDFYSQQGQSNLDKFLGPKTEWRKKWPLVMNRTPENICKFFADEYKAQLKRHLGYKVFGEMPIPRKGSIYRLIYASKHELGLEFWDKVTRMELGGQMDLFR